MRGLIRFVLGIVIFFEAVVFLGHFGDLGSQSPFEWIAAEIVVGVVLVGTIIAYRAAGGNGTRWLRGLGSAGSVVGAVGREVVQPRTGKKVDVYDSTGKKVGQGIERKYGP